MSDELKLTEDEQRALEEAQREYRSQQEQGRATTIEGNQDLLEFFRERAPHLYVMLQSLVDKFPALYQVFQRLVG
ncbi:MAG: hypothetical protein AAGF32_09495 [Pseudomonadota bacterium]